jgi:hypothetical protein
MTPDVGDFSTPACREIFGANPPHLLAHPGGDASPLTGRGLLHQLKQFGFEQHTQRVHGTRDIHVNGPALALGEPPLHDKA